MKKLIIPLILVFMMCGVVLAHYPEVHVKMTLDALKTKGINTIIFNECKENLRECIAGNLAADSTVVYYFVSKDRINYFGTHSASMYINCLKLAGSDVKERAICHGVALHHMQDVTSHGIINKEGYTSICIKEYYLTNLLLHPICERIVEKAITEGSDNADEIISYTSGAYDILEEHPEYVDLLSKSAKVDLSEPIKVVGANLKKTGADVTGESYWNIYGKQYNFPTYYYYFPIIIFFASIICMMLVFKYTSGWAKALLLLILLLPIIFAGLMVWFLAFDPGGAFSSFNGVIDKFGGWFITIDNQDNFIREGMANTIMFLKTGNLEIKDATGLSHYEGNNFIEGTLNKAEAANSTIRWAILFIFLFIVGFLAYKGVKKKYFS